MEEFLIIIYIKENRIEYVLYHEIGHAYDYCMQRISDTEEFKEIFEDEKENFHKYIEDDEYYTANTHEYFAETFEEYVKENENLKNYLPKTYSFIKKSVSYPDPKPTKKNKDKTENNK